ncbi:MAG TPA: SCO family protein [Patescibacteria group bacterium]|nr:SCO family protein [Patescibacteria group bacterium]
MNPLLLKRTAFFELLLGITVGLAPLRSAGAQPLSDAALASIDFKQKLNSQVPLTLRFIDETGAPVRLSDYFGSKPVVLVLGYYKCPMLCNLVLNGLVESLDNMRWGVGQEFVVLNVSIDPEEQPGLAAAKKQTYLKRYGRTDAAAGWHFLTGKEPEIRLLAESVGFGYRFDPATRQYAHPSGLIILTPEGKVARYFFGVNFSSQQLFEALKASASNKVGSPIQKLILLCFHYNPLSGKYSSTILEIVRILSVATVLGLVAVVLVSSRRPKLP